MAGITAWNYFKECLVSTSNTFRANQGLFGKVYFPRVITPLSVTIFNLLKFGIQLFIFAIFYGYFIVNGLEIQINGLIILLPVYIIVMAALGLGFGMIISSMTTNTVI